MKIIKSSKELGDLVRETRQKQGITQNKLAAVCGVGVRFVIELEKGKGTSQLEKTLQLIEMLGLRIQIGTRSEISR